jgi:two-component system nitrate/nitrite response regulator NarL
MIVDNNVLFREGLTNLLEKEAGIKVVGSFGSVFEAVSSVAHLEPDIILIDSDLPDLDESNGIQTLRLQRPQVQVALMSSHASEELLLYAVRNGARGYLIKNSSLTRFMAAIRAMERGEAAIPRAMVGRLLDELSRISLVPEQDGLSTLTQREMDVLCELGHGSTNRQIAERLDIAENTVKVHVHNILEKLNLRNRRQAARFARFEGLVSKKPTNYLTLQISDHSRLLN